MQERLATTMMMVLVAYSLSSQAQDLPDPTRPADFQTTLVVQELPTGLIDWKVTGIRISETDRTAIINDRIVRQGDTIGPATILEIQPIQVILAYDNKQVAVRLFRDVFILKQASNNRN